MGDWNSRVEKDKERGMNSMGGYREETIKQ